MSRDKERYTNSCYNVITYVREEIMLKQSIKSVFSSPTSLINKFFLRPFQDSQFLFSNTRSCVFLKVLLNFPVSSLILCTLVVFADPKSVSLTSFFFFFSCFFHFNISDFIYLIIFSSVLFQDIITFPAFIPLCMKVSFINFEISRYFSDPNLKILF